jgi:hypothetical protein
MKPQILLAVGLVLGTLSGCATHDAGAIDYRVTGGLAGSGDGTPALHIEPNGAATRTLPDGTVQTAVLDRETMADLRDDIERAQFAMLAPIYHCNCADDFVHVVSVALDGTAYTVEADERAEVPETLQTVFDVLGDISESPIWN